MLATVSGLFIPIGGIFVIVGGGHDVAASILTTLLKTAPLPAATFLIITGMYILNDLVDADLDRANGKKRPIPSGQVTKANALLFVIMTNAAALILVLISFNLASIIIVLILIGIGLMYSAPKICLKDRFVLKTASIAVASMLCLMLGSSYAFNSSDIRQPITNYNQNYGSFNITPIATFAALMSGSIIFITSLLNDLGDVEGDKAFGRRTIPVVIGKKNTVILTILIAATMIVISWSIYGALTTNLGLTLPICVSVVACIAILNMSKILKHLDNSEYIRKQHKKSLSLHLMLQSALVIGSLFIWLR